MKRQNEDYKIVMEDYFFLFKEELQVKGQAQKMKQDKENLSEKKEA